MKDDSLTAKRARQVWLTPESCKLEAFTALIDRAATAADYPLAAEIVSDVPIYDGAAIRAAAKIPAERREMMAEWAEAMLERSRHRRTARRFRGPRAGRGGDEDFLRNHRGAASREQIERRSFRQARSANDRVWNALEKLCLRSPEAFARYYANDALAMVCQAWLGTGYQITSQVNCVNPGGEAQSAHRDYHMGFQTAEEIERFPAHAHRLSPMLTLQGAVAHCDMPRRERADALPARSRRRSRRAISPGASPNSSNISTRIMCNCRSPRATRRSSIPALFHAAGHNRTADVRRIANLLQISSAYGRAMESVDRAGMVKALYPCAAPPASSLERAQCANVIAASRRRLRLPHQPRPRSPDRRPRAADPGATDGAGNSRGLERGSVRNGCRRAFGAPADVKERRRGQKGRPHVPTPAREMKGCAAP